MNSAQNSRSTPGFVRHLGPGLMMAAVSIGVSHLVQSTRAGALYGPGMLLIVLLAMAIKYPAFRFGQQYAAVTGVSLLEGFRRQGKWALTLCIFISVATVFPSVAAVSLVAASLAINAFGLPFSPPVTAAGVLVISSLIVLIGRYHWLDILIKLLLLIMTVATLVATLVALPQMTTAKAVLWDSNYLTLPWLFFTVTFIGWMPAPLETPVWQSIWTVAKARDLDEDWSWRLAAPDFHIGYYGTGFLALCFVLLGTTIMYGQGIDLASGATAFAIQLIGLYRQSLGHWSGPVLSLAAFAVIWSTVLVVVDGYPRMLVTLIARFRTPEPSGHQPAPATERRQILVLTALLNLGAMGVLFFLLQSFVALISFATILSFLTAPVYAWLIHRSMTSADIPPGQRISPALERMSLFCIGLMALFAGGYLSLFFFVFD